jgi:hypothetical protein
MFNETLMATLAAQRTADDRRDAARQRRARRQVPAGITRRVPVQRQLHGGPAGPAKAPAATRAI